VRSTALRYLNAFGFGTIAGMPAFSTRLGAPFVLLGGAPCPQRAMTGTRGAAASALGTYGLLDRTLPAGRAGAR
jgi:hypothetical protein